MERPEYRILFIAALLITTVVAVGAYAILPQFEIIMDSFDVVLPIWIAWVYSTYQYWWLLPLVLSIIHIITQVPGVADATTYERVNIYSARVAIVGAIALFAFASLAIYFPVIQSS